MTIPKSDLVRIFHAEIELATKCRGLERGLPARIFRLVGRVPARGGRCRAISGLGAWFLAGLFSLCFVRSTLGDSGTSTVLPYTTGTIITPTSPVVGGTRYGRVIRLQYSGSANGTLIATFEAWANDFGIYESTDDGFTWTQIATTTETQFPGWQFKVEPDLFEVPAPMGNLPAGTILLAGNSVNGNGHQLEIYYSLDHGVTWQYRGMAENNSATLKGIWEPRLGAASNGQLVCYYSDERFAPTYNQLLGERVSPDGGLTWGAEQYVCAIADGVQRPGMAVTTKLPNGQYVVSFEAVGSGTLSQVHIKFSTDGTNWGTGPTDYGTAVQTASGAYLGACPYIMWSPVGGSNGTLVVNAQYLVNSPNTDREFLINTNLGQGNWTMIPAAVQWQGGGNALAGWSQGMIPTWDGQGIIQLASSVSSNTNDNQMLFAREQILLPSATCTLCNQKSGLALEIPGNTTLHGTGLQQWTSDGGPAQQWTFNDQGNNVWTVTNPGNQLAWDDLGWGTTPGTIVDQWDYNGLAVQQWKLRPVGNGAWKFVNVNSGLTLAVTNASPNPGAAIVLWTNTATAEESWFASQPSGAPATYYALDGNALDGSGNGNNGTPSTSATNYVTGRIGPQALQFNGVDADVQIPRSIGAGSSFTIAFWMKTTSTGFHGGPNWWNGTGLVDGEVATGLNDFGVSLLGGKIAFGVGNPDTTLPSTISVNDGLWHHIVATRNELDGMMALYLDGKLNTNTFGPIGARLAPPFLRLGSLQTGNVATFYNGVLDDVRLYNGWLATNQITALATASSGNWSADASDNWSVASRWNSNPYIPGSNPGDYAGLTFSITAPRTVTIDTNSRMVGTLNLGGPTGPYFGYTLAAVGGAQLTFNNGGAGASLVQANTMATDVISAPITLADSLNLSNNSTLTLSGPISGGGGTVSKYGSGVVRITGTDTFSGSIFVKTGTMVVDAGVITNTSFDDVGQTSGDHGTLILQGGGAFTTTSDFNVGDIGNSIGTMNITGAASLIANALYAGSANGAASSANGTINQTNGTVTTLSPYDGVLVIGGRNSASALGVGVYNLHGGVLNVNTGGNAWIGGYGNGALNASGGSAIFSGYVSVGRWPGGVGSLNVSSGTISQTNAARFTLIGEAGTGTLTVSGTGLFNVAGTQLMLGDDGTGSGLVNLNGGALTVPKVVTGAGSGTFNFNGGTLAANASSTNFMTGLTAANVQGGGAIINDGDFAVTIGQALLDGGSGGGLTKRGGGMLTLTGTNTYTGATLINAGALALGGSGSISNTALISLASGAIFDVSALGSPFALGHSQTLSNSAATTGTIKGNLNTSSGTVSVSYVSGIPALTITAGTLMLSVATTVLVNNTGPALGVGSYEIISPAIGGAVAGTLPPVTVNGGGVASAALAINNGGLFLVVNSTVNLSAANLTCSVSGGNLSLSWPADHSGWRLLVQTNHLNLGLSENIADFATVPGSTATNQVSLPISGGVSAEYYRLVYP